ncbi:hypothetical protein F4561_004149 [Lipingzhangella halophila]|uniref:Uncharacterized protein n=1 Tax=Lipingzhangella halophila TaxID=1783352 RepID=A0A7W7W4Z8_9ACTN|nr:hypothetical protein [Lipingzhangella halophila]MBB4933329.1 hypothetical protein [Lipingzhangella halophila]
MSHYPEPQGPGDFYPDPHTASDDPFGQQAPPGGPSNAGVAPQDPGAAQTGGWQAPPDYRPVPAGGQPLTMIGDIAVYQHEVVTPAGRFPIKGTTWTATDMSQVHETLPTYAVVLTIVFVWFCLLGLLFLLMKERSVQGYVQVTVHGSGMFHSTMVPAHSAATFPQVMQQVNYARSLAAMA